MESGLTLVHPSASPRGELRVPGDKSIAQRAVLLSAVSRGESEVAGFPSSGDTLSTLATVERLGAVARREQGKPLRITGKGALLSPPRGRLDLGNSGTGLRLLAGLLAGQPFEAEVTGDSSLCSRPMRRISDPLQRMGARFVWLGTEGFAPFRVCGGALQGIDYRLPVASAQVKSALLLAGLYADGETRLVEPGPARDHTENMLRSLGVPLRVEGSRMTLPGYGSGGPAFEGRRWLVPGDFSSAAFWLVAAAVKPRSEVTVRGVGLNPRRTGLLDVLRRMGADVKVTLTPVEGGEPAGDITVRGGALRGVTVDGDEVASLIDELPLVAVAGVYAEGETVIRDARELRIKESDRIATMSAHLRAMGVPVREREDGMAVRGPVVPTPPDRPFECHGDHRVAMSLAILGMGAGSVLCIRGAACAATSYPDFWEDYRRLGGHVE